jgi:ATP-dependent Clp protease ATP-binding subunit ClpA
MSWLESFWKKAKASPVPPITPVGPKPEAQFTPRAQQVLALSRKEADRLNHHFVGTEHLLLGLLHLGQGVAVTVLARLGVDLETARREVEKHVARGDKKIIGNVPYTPRVKKVLALAARDAKALDHTYVGTEHILLGLLREDGGLAATVLKDLGVDAQKTRQEILSELAPNRPQTNMDPNPVEMPASLDTRKRYDVYCTERNQEVIVYRNALFKGRTKLMSAHRHDFGVDFIELEQSNGKTVFLAFHSVFKFCEHGTEIVGEIIPPK